MMRIHNLALLGRGIVTTSIGRIQAELHSQNVRLVADPTPVAARTTGAIPPETPSGIANGTHAWVRVDNGHTGFPTPLPTEGAHPRQTTATA